VPSRVDDAKALPLSELGFKLKMHQAITSLAALAACGLFQQTCAADSASVKVRNFQVVQTIDGVGYLVDSESLELQEGGYVFAVVARMKDTNPPVHIGDTAYVFKCIATPRFAPVGATVRTGKLNADGSPQYNSYATQFDKTKLEYEETRWLDGTRNAADFACRAVKSRANANRIAQDIYENNGPKDTTTLTCSIVRANTGADRKMVSVRFSDAEGVVIDGARWRRTATVTPTEIRSESADGLMSKIDRRSGELTWATSGLGVIATGQCEVASTVKRF
jgi:hypothetical protein